MLKDGWTAVTKDKSLSAQFEHTVGVTEIMVLKYLQNLKKNMNFHLIQYD